MIPHIYTYHIHITIQYNHVPRRRITREEVVNFADDNYKPVRMVVTLSLIHI